MKRIMVILLIFLLFENVSSNQNKEHTINVALLDALIPSFTSPENMEKALEGYSWQGKNATYRIKVTWINDMDICVGRLKEFDVLIIPGIGKEFWRFFDNRLLSVWKNEIRKFVYNGGGYFGTCGGANLASMGLVSASKRGWKHETMWEFFMNKSALGIAPVKAYQDMADPFACTLIWKNPSRLGQSAYIWYNLSIEGTGVCQNCKINRQHPIFHGYDGDRRIIRWVGGPALIPEGNVTIVAWYPEENLSKNESTRIHAWRFVGEPFDFWDMEEEIIETHLASKPAAISCYYGKGRVIIFGNHPEHPVWRGGRIFERDTNKDRLFKGFFQWRDVQPLPPLYNAWIVRRCVAWVAKVELPPIE